MGRPRPAPVVVVVVVRVRFLSEGFLFFLFFFRHSKVARLGHCLSRSVSLFSLVACVLGRGWGAAAGPKGGGRGRRTRGGRARVLVVVVVIGGWVGGPLFSSLLAAIVIRSPEVVFSVYARWRVGGGGGALGGLWPSMRNGHQWGGEKGRGKRGWGGSGIGASGTKKRTAADAARVRTMVRSI